MNIPSKFRFLLPLFTIFMLNSCGESDQQSDSSNPAVQSATVESEQQLIARAKGIHDRVITLDTHNDINTTNFTVSNNYTQDLDTQVNLPKMETGGLDVAWFIVYTGQATLDAAGYAAAYANAIDMHLRPQ